MFRKVPPIAFPIELSDFLEILRWIYPRNPLKTFEKRFSEAFDLSYCIATSSGRAALTIALRLLKEIRPERTDVIVPAYTCPTIPLSVARTGLNAKLCDISDETLNIDTSLLEGIVGENTLCVVAPHMFGFPCDMDRILEAVKANGIFLIEDVAQAAGAKWKGLALGSFGHLSCFSLGGGKSLTTYEGGVLGIGKAGELPRGHMESLPSSLSGESVFHSLNVLVHLLGMYSFHRPSSWRFVSKLPLGFERQYHSIDFRIARLGNWQAAFGLSVLRRLDEINATRTRNGRYLVQRLQDLKTIAIPKELDGAEPVYLRLPVIAKDRQQREEIYRNLDRAGIGVSRFYRCSLNRYDYLADIVPQGTYSVAEHVADRILALPTHPLMKERDLETIVEILRKS